MLTKENDCYAADVRDGANLVIESGEFIGNVHAVYIYEGSLTVNGGSYYKFNPANCAAEGEGTNFVADGYSVNLSGDYYTVL